MLGLTLEGGASRTVYSCGIMDALLEDKIIADYVIGVSAGAAFGVSYCSGQIGRNLRLATEFMGTKKYMGARHLIDPKTSHLLPSPHKHGTPAACAKAKSYIRSCQALLKVL